MGAPRSGTSWLQAMLGAHPEVASPSELHLFDMYFKRWHQVWEQQAHAPPGQEWRRFRGLSSVLTRQDFEAILTQTVDTVHRHVMDAKPSATVLLEKTPDYSLYVEDIVRYVSEPKFIHLIRDGRDVAVSLLAASSGWGQTYWGGESIESAANRWKTHVLGARSGRDQAHRYFELRYETLRSEAGPRLLQEVFAFCDVEVSDNLCSEIYQQHRIDKMQDSQTRKDGLVPGGELARRGVGFDWPEGFFRRGAGGEWKELWTARACWRFDRVAGKLLRELDYAGPGWAEVGRVRHRSYQALASLAGSRQLLRALAGRGKKLLLG